MPSDETAAVLENRGGLLGPIGVGGAAKHVSI